MSYRKEQHAAYMKNWRANNPDKIKAIGRACYVRNKENSASRRRAYYQANKESIAARSKAKWDAMTIEERQAKTRKNKIASADAIKVYSKKYYAANREAIILKSSKWAKDNKEKLKARLRVWRSNYTNTNPQYRIQHALYKRLNTALKATIGGRKTLKANELLGCTVQELMVRLESMFKPGMSWSNYTITGWHIDHIRPCASFDLNDENEQKKCFHYTNLQPLWAIENIRKGAKAA